MVKKTPVTPRGPQRPAKTDVVTRVSAEAVRDRAYNRFQARGSEHGHAGVETELLEDNNIEIAPHLSLKLHPTGR